MNICTYTHLPVSPHKLREVVEFGEVSYYKKWLISSLNLCSERTKPKMVEFGELSYYKNWLISPLNLSSERTKPKMEYVLPTIRHQLMLSCCLVITAMQW